MPKDGSFKRAVRARAQQTGERYTAVRAQMEAAAKQPDGPLWRWASSAFEGDTVKAFLEQRYGIRVTRMAGFDIDHPSTLWVERSDGPPWVARVMAAGAMDREGRPVRVEGGPTFDERVDRLLGDAEILHWLESHNYPAERLPHPEPVSVLDGWAVMVTEYVEGRRVRSHARAQGRLGDLLGRLHALPLAGGTMSRDGGAFAHGAEHAGRPGADVTASMSFLRAVEGAVDARGRERFEWLADQVANAEDCEGLPEAFTHPNYGTFNAIQRDDGEIVIVSWLDAGRGPRLAALGWLLTAAGRDEQKIDAIVRGYAGHIRVSDEELERLAGAVLMRTLYLACWSYRAWVAAGSTPSGGEDWWPDVERAGLIASRAVATFRDLTRPAAGRRSDAVAEQIEETMESEWYGQSPRSTVRERYRRNAEAFEALIAATRPDQWTGPSPCEDWQARDIVRHVVELTGSTLRERHAVELTVAPSVDDDPLASFRAVRADMERVLADSRVTTQSMQFLDAALGWDLPQHAWDLAMATGQDAAMDPEFVESTWAMLSAMSAGWWEWQRNTIHAYGPPVAVPDGAPLQDRLLGLLGRDPGWRPR